MSRTVPGTHKLHSVVPVSGSIVEVKLYSSHVSSRMERAALCPSITPLPFSRIGGYVTVVYDGSCWLGCVLNVNEQEHASASFFYPKRRDVLDINPSDILTRVQ